MIAPQDVASHFKLESRYSRNATRRTPIARPPVAPRKDRHRFFCVGCPGAKPSQKSELLSICAPYFGTFDLPFL